MSQNGNVLFLILIAVALFAALSYAITQSTRTSGENSSKETAGIMAAQIIQDAATVRSVSTRAIMGGIPKSSLIYSVSPTDISTACTSGQNCVFFQGGALIPAPIPPIHAFEDPAWAIPNYYYQGEMTFTNIGTSLPDILFSYENLTQAVCEAIDRKLGLSSIPVVGASPIITLSPPMQEVCVDQGAYYSFFSVILEN